MSESQLHLTHRAAYLRGVAQGQRDRQAARDYRPRDGATGTHAGQQAYGLGYMDGWEIEANRVDMQRIAAVLGS